MRSTVLRTLFILIALVGGLLAGPANPATAADATPVTYQDFTYASSVGTPPSADKPQNKLWQQDGSWWGLMLNSAGRVNIHQLQANHTWQDTGTLVDDRSNSTGDALWDGRNLHVVSRTGTGDIRVYRFSYFSASRTYALDAGFPVSVKGGGSESATIAIDGTGALWVTFTQGSRVWVAHSNTVGAAWTPAYLLPVSDNTVSSDDLSGVIAFTGKVGIMFSDQATGRFYFAVHQDGAPDTTWSLEIAMQDEGGSDDHINLKNLITDGEGRVFVAVKTSAGDGDLPVTFPLIHVLIRSNTGGWTSRVAGVIGDELTRPQIAIDSTNNRLYMLATAPEAGGKIYYKYAPLNNIQFAPGRGGVFTSWSGAVINNVSTTRDPVTSQTGLVAIATDTAARRYYHTELALGGGGGVPDTVKPTVPTKLVATASATGAVSLSWLASTDNVGVTGYTVLRDGVAIGNATTTTFADAHADGGETHTYTVRASDAAGNSSPTAWPATVWVPDGAGGTGIVERGTTAGTNDTATQLTLPVPGAGQPGDVILASLDLRGNPTVTTPTGWTLIRSDVAGTTMRKVTYRRIVAAGDPANVTWTFSRSTPATGVMLRYDGVSATAPIGNHDAIVVTNATQTLTAPAVTTTSPNSVVVALFGVARNTAISPDPRTTERAESGTTAGRYRVSGEAADLTAAQPGRVSQFAAGANTSQSTSIGQTVVLQAG